MTASNNEWDAFSPLIPRWLVTGEWSGINKIMMRRRDLAGKWEYRIATPDEEVDYVERDGW